jgi:predicted N-acetyltransferase YhbS
LKPQWPGIPDNAFMAMILNAKEMQGIEGVVHYRDEFNEAL